MGIRKWNMPKIDRDRVERLAEGLGLPQIVAEVLDARGYSQEEAEAFQAGETKLHNPFLMKDMDIAAQTIIAAVESGELIAVYGDYDCDGIVSTCMLYSYLQDMGAQVMYYIPDRDREGYGLNRGAVDRLEEQGVSLIVTVDNGISALEEAEYIAEKGIGLVITDHHTPRDTLPRAAAVVDPHRKDCTYPFPLLCGAGVAFKLICALEGDLTCQEMLWHYGDLLSVATVGDIVQLTGENRTIVKMGLEGFSNSENVGLHALMEVGRLTNRPLDSTSLAFGIVPRINAAGRMGQAEKAVRLLLSEEDEEAFSLAEEINEYNEERKRLVLQIVEEIDGQAAKNPSLVEQRVIVMQGRGWHHGVIGIAAAKVVERYGKPCILFSLNGEEARGSARSVEGFSIIEAISRCSSLLTRYGGHNQAAGLSLKEKDLPEFIRQLEQDARERFDIMPVDVLRIDAVVSPLSLTVQLPEDLRLLEPCGEGNESPVAAILGCRLEGVTPLSEDRHIRMRLSKDGKVFSAVYFGMSSAAFPFRTGDLVDIAANLDSNEYNGEVSLSIKVKDVRFSGADQDKITVGCQYYEKYRRKEPLEKKIQRYIRPAREDIALIYRYLKQEKQFPYGYDVLWCRLGGKLNYCKLRICIDVMEEMGLVRVSQGKEPELYLPEQVRKVDLEQSQILKRLKAGED